MTDDLDRLFEGQATAADNPDDAPTSKSSLHQDAAIQIGNTSYLPGASSNRFDINDCGTKIEFFSFDCFDGSEQSAKNIAEKIDPIAEIHNIIATSLGPKPSALTLVHLTNANPSTGLVYLPAKEYKKDYSRDVDLSNITMVAV